jgi:tetratricopeptide (TPR) repeat protein
MAVATGDWAEARKLADHWAKSDKAAGAYHMAVIALERGDLPAAAAAVDVLRQGLQSKKTRSQELRLWEVQGRLMCLTGQGEAGVRLLKRAVDKTKDDYTHHAWGGGAYYMEQWGAAALDAGRAADAEEAFQEALAHDAGSVRGALGLWALCSRLGRTDEAGRFLALAERCWAKADPRDFYRLRDDFARRAANIPAAAVAAAGD